MYIIKAKSSIGPPHAWVWLISLLLFLCAGGGSKVLSEGELVDLWERIDARVGELLEGCEPLPPPPVTFNPTSEVPIEEQK